jgi:signal transduction histidine kinase
VGLNAQEVLGDLAQVRNAFLAALPVALFLAGWGGWLIAGRALRPIASIAATAERVTARGLDQRIPLSRDDPDIDRVIRLLNQMMDRLAASFRQATRFTADASHELRTPLAIMQGELENALQSAPVDSPEQRTFQNLLEETQRLKGISRSLLLLAQADAGQLKLSREKVDLSDLVGGLLEDARILAAPARLEVEAEVEPGIWVEADRAILLTALLNLVTNAVKYNETGGRIHVRLEASRNEAQCFVGNTGSSVPPDEHARIFDRFHRVAAPRRPPVEGVGLGLSLAREMVRAHGGDLDLQESRPGWTCFRLRLKRLVER